MIEKSDWECKTEEEVMSYATKRGWTYKSSRFGGKMFNKGGQLVARVNHTNDKYYIDHVPL